jgi:hypothetical protein
MHEILLRRLGKVKFVYLIKKSRKDDEFAWRSHFNCVTGLNKTLSEDMPLDISPERHLLV